jgi:hypothetical protein
VIEHPLLYRIPKLKPKNKPRPMPTPTLGDLAGSLAKAVKNAESFGLKVLRVNIEVVDE